MKAFNSVIIHILNQIIFVVESSPRPSTITVKHIYYSLFKEDFKTVFTSIEKRAKEHGSHQSNFYFPNQD